jgi:hypothetical protein
MTHMVDYSTYLDSDDEDDDDDVLEIENCTECIFNVHSENEDYTGGELNDIYITNIITYSVLDSWIIYWLLVCYKTREIN